MDRYSFREIIELRDYMDWRGLIGKLNRQYHEKLSYNFNMGFMTECVNCRVCNLPLWNWRSSNPFGNIYENEIYQIKGKWGCFYYKSYERVIELSKNY